MTQTQAFMNVSDADKQTVTETIYWSLEILVGEALAAQSGKPGYDIQEIKDNANFLLQKFGINGNTLVIDDNGARI